jgi:hypothetical protein
MCGAVRIGIAGDTDGMRWFDHLRQIVEGGR